MRRLSKSQAARLIQYQLYSSLLKIMAWKLPFLSSSKRRIRHEVVCKFPGVLPVLDGKPAQISDLTLSLLTGVYGVGVLNVRSDNTRYRAHNRCCSYMYELVLPDISFDGVISDCYIDGRSTIFTFHTDTPTT